MCLCLDGSPVADDKRADGREETWKVGLSGACCAEPLFCICSVLPITAPCVVFFLRKEALGGDNLEDYKCCQGYYDCCCFEGGKCCEKGFPCLCLSIESTLCCCCAVQSTRFYIMDRLQLLPDPCDNRLVRFQNCLQCVGCLTWCVGCILGVDSIKRAGRVVQIVADCVLFSLLGCMQAQVKHELWERGGVPSNAIMTRDPEQALNVPKEAGGAKPNINVGDPATSVQTQQPAKKLLPGSSAA